MILDVSLVTYSRTLLDVSIFTCSFKFINSLRLDMFFMYAVFKVQLTSERKITDKCWKLASINLYLIFYARHVSVVTEQALLVRFGCCGRLRHP